jgi:predicted alpha/beta hydrolase family esterase
MDGLALLRAFNAVVGRVLPAWPARIARNLMLRPRGPRVLDTAGARRVALRRGLSALWWGDSGPVVLALHGWEGRAAQFAPLAAAVNAAGLQLVALDAPAHGASAGTESTMAGFTAALRLAARELGDVEALVGHSLGAAAAARALALGLPARRAVLFAPPSSIEGYLRAFARGLWLPPRAAAGFIRRVEQAAGVPARELDVAALASRLRQPALIVHDRGDRAVPFTEGAAIARAWGGARLLPVEGLGHSRLLADARVVAAATQFLAPAMRAKAA